MKDKPEPLNGKLIKFLVFEEGFQPKSIKSAVEWLKNKYKQVDTMIVAQWDDELQEIYQEFVDVYGYVPKEFKIWLLDKAFEDVTKE